MRVTNRMMTNNVLKNLNRNLAEMDRSQGRMSSGKNVSRPTDDPVAVARILSLRTVLGEQEQFRRNMEDGIDWLDASERALASATSIMQRARELAVYGANGTLSPEDRQALAREVEQLLGEMVQVANTSHGGRYVFGGQMTNQEPFTAGEALTYQGDGGIMVWEVSPKVTMTVNVSGQEAFVDSDVFDALQVLESALAAGETPESTIVDMEGAIENLVGMRATLGARSKRLQAALERDFEAIINQTGLLSRLQDIDLAREVMNFKQKEYVYQAALGTAAMIIQPSLLDFLR